MKIAIVILNYNGKRFLEEFLPNVCESVAVAADAAVFVADNASTDDSVSFLKEKFPLVNLILFSQNYGFAGGYNKSLLQIDADYFVLLNSDVKVKTDWISPLTEYMDAHPDVAACQPKIHSFYDESKFEYAGAAGGYIDKYGFPFCRGRIFSTCEADYGQYDTVQEIFWATGACLMVRKEDYVQMGGLDEAFFAHMEEIDFCWRLQSRGRKIVCVPQSLVFHVGGGTLTVGSPQKTFLNFRNNLLMLYKNLPQKRLGHALFIRKLFDGVAALQFLVSGQLKNFWAVFRAHREFGRIKSRFNEKRKENLAKSNGKLLKNMYQKSIVFQFYFHRVTKFSKLDFGK